MYRGKLMVATYTEQKQSILTQPQKNVSFTQQK